MKKIDNGKLEGYKNMSTYSNKKSNKNCSIFSKVLLYLKLMRIKHYIKNLLIFVPLVFSMSFYNVYNDIKVLAGFILFSLVCSIVYIINDLNDIEKDRNHPKKCNRPLASGSVTKKEAYVLLIILAIIVITGSILIRANIYTVIILIFYLVLNILYSKYLKKIPIIDVICLVLGFVIRVIYGALLINVEVSNWLYLTIITFSFYLALGKRRNELQGGKNSRDVLKYYKRDFLDKNMYMFLSLMIMFYSMWCVDQSNILKFNNKLIYTIPILMIIAMRYSYDIESSSEGDPIEVLFSDKMLIILVLLFIFVMAAIILI